MKNGSELRGFISRVSFLFHGNSADYRPKRGTYPCETIASLSHTLQTGTPPSREHFSDFWGMFLNSLSPLLIGFMLLSDNSQRVKQSIIGEEKVIGFLFMIHVL